MKISTFLGAATTAALISGLSHAATLDDVKARGELKCGGSQGLAGFSSADDKGRWAGLDVDLCRGIAAAIFGDANKVKFIPLSSKERFTALSSGEVDVLSRNTTKTMSRDVELALDLPVTNYFDGQGVLVPVSLGIKSIKELNGASICVNTGTTTELNITDYFNAHNLKFELVAFERADEVAAAYDSGRCQVYTSDRSGLAGERLKFKDPEAHVVLPEVISKEPLSAAVRQNDSQWSDIVAWTHYVMLNAEEMGVTSANVDEMLKSDNIEIQRLLGVGDNAKFGQSLGVSGDWAYNIIKQVGNYGESYERNVGPNSPLKLERGMNALWTNGGLQYGIPVR